jgi:uncharacterized repeat protein (TIGR03803 family)
LHIKKKSGKYRHIRGKGYPMLRSLAFGALALALWTVGNVTHASTFTILYDFCSQPNCTDGSIGEAPIVSQPGGLLLVEGQTPGAPSIFGTTTFGGARGDAVAFELTPNSAGNAYAESVLYSFCSDPDCAAGGLPDSPLLMDSLGNLYGTATLGGNSLNEGAIFELVPGSPAYSSLALYTFCSLAGCVDGQDPNWLIAPGDGFLYGTTSGGGAGEYGTPGGVVFKFSAGGGETVLHSFCSDANCADGNGPVLGLTSNGNGNFFGATQFGGAHNEGTVFELLSGGGEAVLYSFCSRSGCKDGLEPAGPLLLDRRGRLYGVTLAGGKHHGGEVFRFNPATGDLKILYDFCSINSARVPCADGETPFGGLVRDTAGDIYGTTMGGASAAVPPSGGTIFELTRSEVNGKATYSERVLASFAGPPGGGQPCDQCFPRALSIDSSGNLYGLIAGGSSPTNPAGGGVFKLTP